MRTGWLQAFLTFSLSMNFTQAAAEQNISQPARAALQLDQATKQVGELQSKLSQLENSQRQTEQAVPTAFYVWLKSAPNRNALQNEIPAITEKYKSVLGDLQLTMQFADLGQRGFTYRIVAGPLGAQREAKELCMKIKGVGGDKACFVIMPCFITGYCNLTAGNVPISAQRPWELLKSEKWIFEIWGQPKSARRSSRAHRDARYQRICECRIALTIFIPRRNPGWSLHFWPMAMSKFDPPRQQSGASSNFGWRRLVQQSRRPLYLQ